MLMRGNQDAQDIMIKKLNSIINQITSEGLQLQKKYTDCQQELNVLKSHCNKLYNDLFQTEKSAKQQIQRINIAQKTDVPELLMDYLQVWGFTENEARVVCDEMGIQSTDQFKNRLKKQDWEPGGDGNLVPPGDIYNIFVSDLSALKKDYLWWLHCKLTGQASRLNADIIKEISSKWRYEKQTIYSLGPHLAGMFRVI
jgi:hypothetical protein